MKKPKKPKVKRPVGRPRFEVTDEKREQVQWLAATGSTQQDCAEVFDIALNTFILKFGRDFRLGRPRKRARTLELLVREAENGNVAAIKALRAETQMTMRPFQEPAQPKPAKLGKKEVAQLQAENPDTSTTMGDLMSKRMGQVDAKSLN